MVLKIPVTIVELEPESFHLFIEIKLNGKIAHMLLDTGASKTVFDVTRISNFIRKRKKFFDSFEKQTTGLGTNTMESHFTFAKTFQLGALELKDFRVILLDMSHVNESYCMLKKPGIDGVLGSDLLMKYHAVIDYQKKILKLKI